MLHFSKDLLSELQRQRERNERAQRALIDEVHRLIQEGESVDTELMKRISSPGPAAECPGIDARIVYSPDVIREICVRYRLRFLPLRYYKPALPYEALIRVRNFEQENKTQLQNLYVLAPAPAFHLEKKTDPLLFAGLTNGSFALIHRWGSDLAWHRKLLMYPLRNFQAMAVTLIGLSLLLALALPTSWITWNEQMARMTYSVRMFIFFMFVLASLFTALYLHVKQNRNLSEDEWDSKFL